VGSNPRPPLTCGFASPNRPATIGGRPLALISPPFRGGLDQRGNGGRASRATTGLTWVYRSTVMPVVECPSRSLTTFLDFN
jgi:hypothetical protein